jgi:ABC-2 type transport system permease protein
MTRDLSLLGWQVRYEQRAFWRTRRAAVMTFLFPIMLLLLFGFLNSGNTIDTRQGISYVTFFVPGMLAYATVTTGFSNIMISLARARELGVIKRVQGTPLPWWVYVSGRILSTLLVVLAMTVVVLVIGAICFGVDVRASTLPGLVASMALGAICFTALGFAVARFIGSSDTAGPVQAAIILPISFISGTFFPLDGAPDWLVTVSKVFPVQPLADGLQTAFDPHTLGSGLVGDDLLRLAIWAVVGIAASVRFAKALSARA